MSEAHPGGCAAIAAGWLSLAAAPTFATVALLMGILGDGPPTMLCAAGRDALPFGGMVPMYLLMSLFHLAPWLRLIAGRTAPSSPSGTPNPS
jgi:hypothetical protein